MAENGHGASSIGHHGRIPNYGKSQVNPMGNIEPPACIQNAMMTKDKKPFTYTPGGLDLSQIKTPSMARRMNRQRSLEEHEQGYPQAYQGYPQAYTQAAPNAGGYHQPTGPAPPPPPPLAPAPPPPPPLVIEAPNSKSPKPIIGERPEIVIPEDPIRMLRKTNSPYHWEAEKAEMQKMGPVPKFQDKVPSPLTVQMAPSSFSQQPPQTYAAPGPNNFQRQNYPYNNQNNQAPDSPIHRPEAQYAHQKPMSPNINGPPVTREVLQRQDSQFNKSPQPFSGQSPVSNGTSYSPAQNNNWRQPDRRDSPALAGPQSPLNNRNQFSQHTPQYSPNYQNQNQPAYQHQTNHQNQPTYQSPPSYQNNTSQANSGPAGFHTLPRSGPRAQDNFVSNNVQNNTMYNNNNAKEASVSAKVDTSNPAKWKTNTLNTRIPREAEDLQSLYHNSQTTNQQPTYTPPWKTSNVTNNKPEPAKITQYKQDNKTTGNQQQLLLNNSSPWIAGQDANNNRVQEEYIPPWKAQANDKKPAATPQPAEQPRYQSSMSIPVTPRKQNPPPPEQNVRVERVYVTQEPVYYCPGPPSPKSIPPWVKTQKEKTKTPPPDWVQKPLEKKSDPRELVTPPRDAKQEPEWVKKSTEMQRNMREVLSPPKYIQPVQPTWSTIPSENRKSLPKDNVPNAPGPRVIPIQVEPDQGRQGNQLRGTAQGQGPPLSQPTQRIMRVLSPPLVKMDDVQTQTDLPTLNRSFPSKPSQETQVKTRIIPIQIEGDNAGANKRVYYHKFIQEAPPRQSKAFKVLQIITGTQDMDLDMHTMEQQNGFSDL